MQYFYIIFFAFITNAFFLKLDINTKTNIHLIFPKLGELPESNYTVYPGYDMRFTKSIYDNTSSIEKLRTYHLYNILLKKLLSDNLSDNNKIEEINRLQVDIISNTDTYHQINNYEGGLYKKWIFSYSDIIKE
jgi:hypothetical protein